MLLSIDLSPHSQLTSNLDSYPPARELPAGGHRRGQRGHSVVSHSRGPDRRGGQVQQTSGLGPTRLRSDLREGKHGDRSDGHICKSKVCCLDSVIEHVVCRHVSDTWHAGYGTIRKLYSHPPTLPPPVLLLVDLSQNQKSSYFCSNLIWFKTVSVNFNVK